MSQSTRTSAAGRSNARAAASAPAEDGAFTHRQILTIIAGLMVAMFLAALDQTVVATAIRTIADDLQGYDLQAWATTAFLITSTISTPLYGKLSDIYGRRPFYLFAIGVFVVGSVLCGIAGSMYQLAAYRALQGIGAGGLMSLALAIIGDIVPPRERSRYQGYFMAVFGTSSVLGPVLGGFLAGQSSLLGLTGWRWIFLINVPLGALAFAAVYRVLHLPHERREHRIDWPGALALVTSIVPLLIVAEQGRLWGWTSGRALVCYAIGAVGLVLFLLAERAYRNEALLPLRLFGIRSFTIASLGSVVIGAGMFGGLLLLPQYLQIVHGSSATVAGLQMIPLVAGIMIGAMSSGIAISRTGKYKVFPLAGTTLMAAGLLSLSFVVGAETSIWTLVPFMVLLGIGLGFNFQPAVLAVQNAVPPRQIGVATSSVTFFRQMGATIGTAAFLSVLFSRLPVDIDESLTSAAATDRRVAQALQGGQLQAGSDLSDTSFIQDLPSFLALPFKAGFSDSIDLVFLIAAAVSALGFFVFLFLPQLALSNKSGIQARRAAQQTAGAASADEPAEQATQAVGAAAPTSTAPPTGRPGDAAPNDPGGDVPPVRAARHSFDVVLRGYDRHQAAEAIERLEADIQVALADRDAAMSRSADLAGQLSALHAEIDQLRRTAASSGPPTSENVSERIQHMLQLAEEEATEIRRSAEQEAQALREHTAAEERAMHERHAAGQAEVDRMLAEARQTAEQIATRAQIRADELVADMQEKVARLDAESQARRAKVEEDFEIAQRARRQEAARLEEERARSSTEAAQQRIAAAEQHAAKLVSEAEAAAAAVRAVRDELTGRLREAFRPLDRLPDLGDRRAELPTGNGKAAELPTGDGKAAARQRTRPPESPSVQPAADAPRSR
ncbi:DHA2 family efflux MFS transporter permease subunit [Geodermatophilus sp. URMC 61]|uniref:DHA2 family efflux MFS transporter permease subunit n=1 Tax=Geodermatophilus sp. URMC 61 TaxID=3423411 RepID=UPI00406C7D29